jgi:gliding motility-associated-like protein
VKMISDYPCVYTDEAYSDTLHLDVEQLPVAEILIDRDTICETDGQVVLNIAANNFEVLYQWSSEKEILYTGSEAHTLYLDAPEESGFYFLKASGTLCPSDFDTVNIKIYEQPKIGFLKDEVHINYTPGNFVQIPLEIKPLLYDSISAIHWYSDHLLGYHMNGHFYSGIDSDTLREVLFFAVEEDIITSVEASVLTGPDGIGCKTTSHIPVYNYKPVNIPNAFSPNGDGLNDTWIIRGLFKYPDTKVRIFNRWGSLIFENLTGYKSPWDGIVRGSKVPIGTYYYVIEFAGSTDGTDYSESGWLVVLE